MPDATSAGTTDLLEDPMSVPTVTRSHLSLPPHLSLLPQGPHRPAEALRPVDPEDPDDLVVLPRVGTV
jgi:hypothetical protein